MRKVKAICVYKDNKIYNLTALGKHYFVTLVRYDLDDTKETPCSHESFEEMYLDVLRVLKANNLTLDHYTEFEREWYDISFINLDDPTKVSRFSVGGVKNA